jgi:hypothetical protein
MDSLAFDDWADYLLNAIENIGRARTTGTAGFAGNVVAVLPPPHYYPTPPQQQSVDGPSDDSVTLHRACAALAAVYSKYCWTHGFNHTHDSPDCNNKDKGHKDAATATNRMGGSVDIPETRRQSQKKRGNNWKNKGNKKGSGSVTA